MSDFAEILYGLVYWIMDLKLLCGPTSAQIKIEMMNSCVLSPTKMSEYLGFYYFCASPIDFEKS